MYTNIITLFTEFATLFFVFLLATIVKKWYNNNGDFDGMQDRWYKCTL